MSDRPIQVGDLVQVVRANPCGCYHSVGRMFRVEFFDRSNRMNKCHHCGHLFGPFDLAAGDGIGASIYRLKRIPPLSELEGQRAEETLREPVGTV